MQLKEETLDISMTTYFENEHGVTYYLDDHGYVLTKLKQPYIPISEFMQLFNKTGDLIKSRKAKKFILDKRLLRAFHQPTMEWYFVEWKEDMYKHGLTVHRKLIPEEKWFRRCIEAGRAEINDNYPNACFHQLDIQYRDSIPEAIES